MSQQKPTIWPSRQSDLVNWKNKAQERVETPVEQEIWETDSGRSQGKVVQVISAPIADKLVTMFPTFGRSRGGRTVEDSSGTQDDPIRILLQTAAKSMLPTLDHEKCYL